MTEPYFPAWIPPFAAQLMPQPQFDAVLQALGLRLGWMKSHACPCTYATDTPGSPDPNCNTCHGRGRYWDNPLEFVGLRTFMHTASAPDEPGAIMNDNSGRSYLGEPTITVPFSATDVWNLASELDAFIELDSKTRFNTVLQVGGNTILPYQQNLDILDVTGYDVTTKQVFSITNYEVSGAAVLISGYETGQPYTVEYNAAPVYVAWRRAGATPHDRQFGAGTGNLPVRFRAMLLDLWTRARNNFGVSTSPQSVGNP